MEMAHVPHGHGTWVRESTQPLYTGTLHGSV
jgi:hypothetical protein